MNIMWFSGQEYFFKIFIRTVGHIMHQLPFRLLHRGKGDCGGLIAAMVNPHGLLRELRGELVHISLCLTVVLVAAREEGCGEEQ